MASNTVKPKIKETLIVENKLISEIKKPEAKNDPAMKRLKILKFN